MFQHTKPPAGTQINPLHPLSNGLVGCWLFNEGAGSLANDISGYKNHGRLTNMSPNVQGSGWGGSKFGGGLDYDGVDDYVDCGDDSSLELSEWTFDMWVNRKTDSGTYERLLAKSGLGGDYGRYFQITNTDTVQSAFVDTSEANCYVSTTDTIPLNTWKHLTTTFNGTYIKIYIDGVLKATSSDFSSSTPQLTTGWDLYIGRLQTSYKFNGSIRSVNIYNQAKSAEEIAWSYKEPYAMFEPAFNPALLYSAAPPVGAVMNQFQKANIGADLYNGVFA